MEWSSSVGLGVSSIAAKASTYFIQLLPLSSKHCECVSGLSLRRKNPFLSSSAAGFTWTVKWCLAGEAAPCAIEALWDWGKAGLPSWKIRAEGLCGGERIATVWVERRTGSLQLLNLVKVFKESTEGQPVLLLWLFWDELWKMCYGQKWKLWTSLAKGVGSRKSLSQNNCVCLI